MLRSEAVGLRRLIVTYAGHAAMTHMAVLGGVATSACAAATSPASHVACGAQVMVSVAPKVAKPLQTGQKLNCAAEMSADQVILIQLMSYT